MKKKILSKFIHELLLTFLWVFSASAIGQNITVNGNVQDETGEPIIGATIQLKGSSIGTITDMEGNFTLRNVPPTGVLVFSYVGYATQEVPVNNRKTIDVILKESAEALEEVVVVGYGVQKRESIVGAISSVDPGKLKQSSSVSLGSTLAGRISGLTALTSSGQPGWDDAKLYLRGVSTLNDASPLIIIDGVPRDNIRQIDPSEIATISVLKDASATAVYGVRSANGVIIITTKRGNEGPAKLVVSAEEGFSSLTREPERLHSVEYLALRNEASINDGKAAPYSDEIIAKYENPLAGLDPKDPNYQTEVKLRKYIYPDHDYYRELISRYTPQTRINANVSGGMNKVSYFAHAGFIYQGGNLKTESKSKLGYDPSSHMVRYTFRSNFDYQMSSSVSSFLNISSEIERVNMPSPFQWNNDTQTMMRDILQKAKSTLPITPGPTTIEGYGVPPDQTVEIPYLENKGAFRQINRNGYRNEVSAILNSTVGFKWDLSKLITQGLSVDGQLSFDSRASTILQGDIAFPQYNAIVDYENNGLSYTLIDDNPKPLTLSKYAVSRYTVNLQGKVNYNRQFDKHNVSGMILAQRDYWESFAGEMPYNVLGIAARATYDFDSRYFGEFNMGYNGSEQFAPTNRFGFFPAFSVGWLASNEEFLKENTILTYLKLRGSYGKTGNDKIGGQRFLYLDNIQMYGGGPLPSLGRGQFISFGLLGNPYLSWEESWKKNIGIDFGIIKDFRASFDYFNEDRSKILITRGMVPALQGVPLYNIPKANMGKVNNKGFEVEFTYNKNFNKDFSMMVTGNFGHSKNKVIFYDEPMRGENFVYRYRTTGFPLGQMWGYKIDWKSNGGYWTSQDEITDSGLSYGFGKPRVGDFKYIDQNGDHVVDDKDQVPIGYSNMNPENIYGVTLTLNYKAFDFMIFLQGVSKYSDYYDAVGVFEHSMGGSYTEIHKNAWTLERFENHEKITYPALSTSTTTNHIPNDFFIMDRSYLRLRNLEIGYTFSEKILKNTGINNIRIFANGQNLYTWDHLRIKFVDPESNQHIIPVTKMINFGVGVTF